MDAIKDKLEKAGQSHLLHYWADLNESNREELLHEINEINLDALNSYFTRCQSELTGTIDKVDSRLEPLPAEAFGSACHTDPTTLEHYRTLGLRAIARGELGVLLLAGGQGTRLNVSYPKGMFKVGLLSDKSLYQIQAERIRQMEKLADEFAASEAAHNNSEPPSMKARIIWYIMTSEHTKAATEDFFHKHNYFGIDPQKVVIFEQFTLPALTFDGKIILAKKHRISNAPDGNGGLYRALAERGMLNHMREHNVKSIHVYCVDNILVRLADPIFVGFCLNRDADVGAKVVEKVEPKEAVGVIGVLDGHYQVIEYSEITLETASRRNPTDPKRLLFNAGNICNHYFTCDFLDSVTKFHEKELKHHVAKKKIPYVDEEGNEIEPSKPNGFKLEKFVFDVFQFSQRMSVWEVNRDEEFAPLKNADGPNVQDCAHTCQRALYAQHLRWLLEAGAIIQAPCKQHTVDHLPNEHIANGLSTPCNGCPGQSATGPAQLQPDSCSNCEKDGLSSANCSSPDLQNGETLLLTKQSPPELVQYILTQCDIQCEISPLVSCLGENLESKVSGRLFVPPIFIE